MITPTKVVDVDGLAILDDLHTALVQVSLGEHLEPLVGFHGDRPTRTVVNDAVLHLGHGYRRDRRPRRDGRRPLHAGLQFVHGQLLPVDREAKVVGNGQLPGAFRQPDDQLVAIDGEDFKPLVFRRRRRLLCLRRDGRDTDEPRGQGHTKHCTSHHCLHF